MFNILVAVVLLLSALGASSQPTAAQSGGEEISRDAQYVPGEVVVGFDEIAGVKAYSAQALALAGTVGAQVVDLNGATALLSFAEDADVNALAGQIGGQAGVRYAEPNYIFWTPEESPRGGQHQLTGIERTYNMGNGETQKVTLTKAELLAMRSTNKTTATYPSDGWENWGWYGSGAWKIWNSVAASPVVCVVDTGVDITHPDLKVKIQPGGWDYVNDDALPMDDNGHGTHVAGTIAAVANNKITGYIGMAGISNGKILPVKVLSAQGWGTTFDIAAGIRRCADNIYVKVINMSLGGSVGSTTQWYALDYAINYKGKLLVAAAGNSSLSLDTYSFYPANWADPTEYPNGTGLGGSYGTNIAQAVLTVGAVTVDDRWMDFDGDSTDNEGEAGSYECAASFSNYGTYVEIVAPGEDIFATTPFTAPFYSQYFYGGSQAYDWYSGTSMAAPHVAAGAARAWSIYKTDTAAQMKQRLLNTGDAVWAEEDPNWDDSTIGFSANYGGDAPYCWPNSMTNSVALNVALAMGRTALSGAVMDARTGLPLVGTLVTARNYYTKVLVPGTKSTVESVWGRWWDLLNVPVGTWYEIGYYKPGYTAGTQYVNTSWIYAYEYDERTWTSGDPTAVLSIPNIVSLSYYVVLDWNWWLYDGQEMDLYVYLPAGAPSGAVYWGSPGTLRDWPWARWMREAGPSGDWVTSETVAIRKLNTTNLRYNPTGTYYILARDWGDETLNDGWPMIRIWDAGKVISWLGQGWYDEDCTAADTWWLAYIIQPNGALAPTKVDQCDPASLTPYAEGLDPLQGIPGSDGGTKP
ncbi:MAG: S8 family serine peptidase [Chloroflexi bacterium]|nr:S8 family serine peptidase [Chloroflexota bacterium]